MVCFAIKRPSSERSVNWRITGISSPHEFANRCFGSQVVPTEHLRGEADPPWVLTAEGDDNLDGFVVAQEPLFGHEGVGADLDL